MCGRISQLLSKSPADALGFEIRLSIASLDMRLVGSLIRTSSFAYRRSTSQTQSRNATACVLAASYTEKIRDVVMGQIVSVMLARAM